MPDTPTLTRSAQLRQELGYPVLDGDGHVVELLPVLFDFIRDNGGEKLLTGMLSRRRTFEDLSLEERRAGGIIPHSWHVPANTNYYATVTSPKRYHDRLGEAGIDFAVIYPTMGISLLQLHDEEQRVGLCRLYNEFMADQFGPYQDTFTVAACIPMHTPEEGIASLEHAKSLGAKVGMIPSHVHRAIPGRPELSEPDEYSDVRVTEWETRGWWDTFGLDSKYDYDPFWAKAIELGIPVAGHTAGQGASDRASVSNFVYNQAGHFAASGAALAKSLFLGGVLSRFPDLRVAILEGGAAPGAESLVTLAGNYDKRGGSAIEDLDPTKLDGELLYELLVEADPRLAKYSQDQLAGRAGAGMKHAVDNYAAANVSSVDDIVRQWNTGFAWGCEADDPFTGLAWDTRILPKRSTMPAFFASDLGHWDVSDFDEPLEEAFELVEHGILDHDQLKEFLFLNPVKFYGAMNPDFFTDTAIEKDAKAVLGL